MGSELGYFRKAVNHLSASLSGPMISTSTLATGDALGMDGGVATIAD